MPPAGKGPYSQSYGFSSSHVWRWKLNHKEGWAPKNWCFSIWRWRSLLRVSWTARLSNPSILKEISPKYSLEGLMLKLRLQHFDHLMRRTDSLEKTLLLRTIESWKRRGDRGWDSWMASSTQWTWVEQTPGDSEGQGNLVCYSPWGHKESDMIQLLNNSKSTGLEI